MKICIQECRWGVNIWIEINTINSHRYIWYDEICFVKSVLGKDIHLKAVPTFTNSVKCSKDFYTYLYNLCRSGDSVSNLNMSIEICIFDKLQRIYWTILSTATTHLRLCFRSCVLHTSSYPLLHLIPLFISEAYRNFLVTARLKAVNKQLFSGAELFIE